MSLTKIEMSHIITARSKAQVSARHSVHVNAEIAPIIDENHRIKREIAKLIALEKASAIKVRAAQARAAEAHRLAKIDASHITVAITAYNKATVTAARLIRAANAAYNEYRHTQWHSTEGTSMSDGHHDVVLPPHIDGNHVITTIEHHDTHGCTLTTE